MAWKDNRLLCLPHREQAAPWAARGLNESSSAFLMASRIASMSSSAHIGTAMPPNLAALRPHCAGDKPTRPYDEDGSVHCRGGEAGYAAPCVRSSGLSAQGYGRQSSL